MKSSKAEVRRKVHKIPSLQFEAESAMTRFAGLIVFQPLFIALGLKARLTHCFSHIDGAAIYRSGTMYLLLVIQLLLGFRRLRGLDCLRGDPLVGRIVGLDVLPDVATMSRMLSGADARSVEAVRSVSRDLVLDRLEEEHLRVVTLDFDGTVQSTKGHAEGTAVGFNKKKKGSRSYYPLLCTVAQLSMVLDMHHRSGNVHDSNGALEFMSICREAVRARLRKARIETRFDSAFYQNELLTDLAGDGVEFTGSVPFERFPELKRRIAEVDVWERHNATWSSAKCDWKPKSWKEGHRLILFRKRRAKQRKGPLQLDLFEPREYEFEYKAVVTNKTGNAGKILLFHNGRGAQEKLIGDCKQHAAVDVVATRTACGNQLFTWAGVIAHNLSRELQMRSRPMDRSTWPKRPALWIFQSLGTLRQRVLHRAGRLIRPQGELTLRISADAKAQEEITSYVDATRAAA